MNSMVDAEHQQLVSTWRSINFDKLLSAPRRPVFNLLEKEERDIGMSLRHVHDMFGWKAKDGAARLGLCAGALYRTQAFMEIPQSVRSGRKVSQNIHIEHTVPVNVLTARWLRFRSAGVQDLFDLYAWVLTCSVATAFANVQKSCLIGCSKSSSVFAMGHLHHGRPFMRYTVDPDLAQQIYNVVTGERVEPARYSLHDHLGSIFTLMSLASVPSCFAATVSERCRLMVDRILASP